MDFGPHFARNLLLWTGAASIILVPLSVIVFSISFFIPKNGRRKIRLIAVLLFLSGPVIDYARLWSFRHYQEVNYEILEQRNNLPITNEMNQKITGYAAITKVNVIKSKHYYGDPNYKPTHATIYIDVKKAGTYVVWVDSKGYSHSLSVGENIIESDLDTVLGSDLTIWQKIEYVSTDKEVYGKNYPSIDGRASLDINQPRSFPVFEGYVPINLSYYPD